MDFKLCTNLKRKPDYRYNLMEVLRLLNIPLLDLYGIHLLLQSCVRRKKNPIVSALPGVRTCVPAVKTSRLKADR